MVLLSQIDGIHHIAKLVIFLIIGMNMFEIIMNAVAIRAVFEMQFEIKDEHLIELTFEQYQAAKRQGFDVSERLFRVSRGMFKECNNPQIELNIVSESEIENIRKAIATIYRLSDKSGKEFDSFYDRLKHLKNRLPQVMTEPLNISEERSVQDEDGMNEDNVVFLAGKSNKV